MCRLFIWNNRRCFIGWRFLQNLRRRCDRIRDRDRRRGSALEHLRRQISHIFQHANIGRGDRHTSPFWHSQVQRDRQSRCQSHSAGITILWLFRETALDHCRQRGRNSWIELLRRWRRCRQMLLQNSKRTVPPKRRPARAYFIKHYTQRIDVARRSIRVALRLLRRNIQRRSHEELVRVLAAEPMILTMPKSVRIGSPIGLREVLR